MGALGVCAGAGGCGGVVDDVGRCDCRGGVCGALVWVDECIARLPLEPCVGMIGGVSFSFFFSEARLSWEGRLMRWFVGGSVCWVDWMRGFGDWLDRVGWCFFFV